MYRQIGLILILFALSVCAQSINRSEIINSGNYYYGRGVSQNFTEAKDRALEELTSQIAIHVASSFKQVVRETDDQLTDNVESILKTHSAATLRNVETDDKSLPDGRIDVFCYLKKSEVENIWNERRQLIAEMARKAEQYARDHNIAHALKFCYFSAILLNSLPDENVIYNGKNYTTEIPERINAIIDHIHFSFVCDKKVAEKERQVTLRVTHRGAPVTLIDFFFWDGTNQVSVQGRDGLATFHLLGASVKFNELKVFIKTSYYENRSEIKVVQTLWDVVQKPSFSTRKIVKLTSQQPRLEQVQRALQKKTYNFNVRYEEDIPVADKMVREAGRFMSVLQSGHTDSIKNHYGSDPFLCKKIIDYVKHNHPKPLERNIRAEFNPTGDGYELRRIRVLHTYPSIHQQSTEYLVLDFNRKGILQDVNTCITEQLYDRFVKQAEYGNDWGNRQQIIKFLEKYRSAYLTRDIKTVDMMFAEDAIIIIGRKLETKKLPDGMVNYQPLGKQPEYDYIKRTKKEYLKRQQGVFQTMQDIFLDFSSFNIIRKNNQPSIYGVEMRQTYRSTTYGDEGYLFLLIDFEPDTLAENPLIYVRAWQPNAWNPEEIIKTSDFIVHK
ncbi:hypothetical protein GF407_02460 [candidate division KSB1 bacterium]|nr:hypothetical protein [candidate division KSB1 bacterium]